MSTVVVSVTISHATSQAQRVSFYGSERAAEGVQMFEAFTSKFTHFVYAREMPDWYEKQKPTNFKNMSVEPVQWNAGTSTWDWKQRFKGNTALAVVIPEIITLFLCNNWLLVGTFQDEHKRELIFFKPPAPVPVPTVVPQAQPFPQVMPQQPALHQSQNVNPVPQVYPPTGNPPPYQ
mmetsp:Transcript_5700/g.7971  ORF Transcript_5700/g.7971 Transcript_5700/m.7971 type:complete len:177 (-) Transcript_5700:62-592(-)|eukprot:CAMPEP_0168562682 /NCGR_PEP_ID=MMETSP0413-20121227/12261_1 /TAXON_ID=136452 /ORGANISM="Filamoeba nolandi, Strain NC-AS-23-1" /LENGTH=176 /DNA_ID=CAMNT_0008594141 /DNA_START=43 /DNA_END=573 /DNA_ORIENTATION=+